jgi:hypothetical protein
MPKVVPQESEVIMVLPQLADDLVDYRFPDCLDMEVVRHSDQAYTVTLMDLDYRHYTFRLILGLSGRWTLVPISGFDYDVRLNLD